MSEKPLHNEAGYTLLETVVALALFLSVLIPLGVTIGNLITDNQVELRRISLSECQAEMTRIINERDYSIGKREVGSHLVIERTVARTGALLEINVNSSFRGKSILSLHRTLLIGQ